MRGVRLLFALAILVLAGLRPAGAQAPLIADLDDHLIAITTGFAGADVLLFGTTDGPGDVIVVVEGPVGEVDVRRKERVGGIWINRKTLGFQNVPAVYMLAASKPLDQLLPADQRAYYQMGIENIRLVPVDPRDSDLKTFTSALVRAKQQRGLFFDQPARILFISDRLFRVNLRVPSTVPTGTYLAKVFLVREQKVVGAFTTPLVISKIGFGADIYDFAHRHSAAYGVIAILVALFAGWMAHLAFRRR
ncbi:TIGR02186 family protein [Dongia rigui]|uniref:TIGR02186 family protein n=1 Tax=Dongia rigui TaxID=940149 RepID=A0ABU5DX44_9PROT|nr:TIGR02186 family protein [Dongia rigui]MDY0871883.1 TIGR02186 family protein [Dongia rigui]